MLLVKYLLLFDLQLEIVNVKVTIPFLAMAVLYRQAGVLLFYRPVCS